ncbi:MAG: alpha/beta fold hydrolase [Brevundimonas diminuta]|nr:alpha/beta fold hydrolase [Brevundimonas diminuta]
MIIVAAAAISAGGCSVNVPENAFLYPDARIAAEKIELTPGPAMPPSAQPLTLPYARGQLATTRLSSTKDDQAPLILFCGGNMFRQSAYGGLVGGQLAAFGDVLLFDYPGYGASTGASDIAGMKAAVAAMAARARAIADREQRRLILWGHSLGGTVCAEGAVNAKADVLVLGYSFDPRRLSRPDHRACGRARHGAASRPEPPPGPGADGKGTICRPPGLRRGGPQRRAQPTRLHVPNGRSSRPSVIGST